MSEVCCELGHDGVLAKRLDAPYLPGRRTRTWLKRKSDVWKRDHAPRRRPQVRV
jgi:ATP-dependent DNA ligase